MPWAAAGAAIGAIGAAAISSGAAGDAASQQAGAAQAATAQQLQMFDQTQANLQPYMTAGQQGLNALTGLVGTGTPGSGGGGMGYDQLYQQLLPQFTTTSSANPPSPASLGITGDPLAQTQWGYDPTAGKWGYQVTRPGGGDAGNPTTSWVYANNYSPTGSQSIDTAGLNAAIQQRMAQEGSGGTRGFSFQYDPAKDPLYNFMLQQGTNAIAGQASAAGGLNSGATLKALQNYGQNTALSSYQTEFGNALQSYQTNVNAAQNLANLGESAAAGVGNAAIGTGNAIANNLIGAGNAAAAGTIGSANALSSGLTSLLSNNQLQSAFQSLGNNYQLGQWASPESTGANSLLSYVQSVPAYNSGY